MTHVSAVSVTQYICCLVDSHVCCLDDSHVCCLDDSHVCCLDDSHVCCLAQVQSSDICLCEGGIHPILHSLIYKMYSY